MIHKFRAWDGEKMHSPDDFWMSADGHAAIFNKGFIEFTHWELMQYTGLKDKNGKDLYEGDYIKVSYEFEDDEVYKIVWGGDTYPAFDLFPQWPGDANGLSEIVCGDFSMEIVGNIYENPELLEGERK